MGRYLDANMCGWVIGDIALMTRVIWFWTLDVDRKGGSRFRNANIVPYIDRIQVAAGIESIEAFSEGELNTGTQFDYSGICHALFVFNPTREFKFGV